MGTSGDRVPRFRPPSCSRIRHREVTAGIESDPWAAASHGMIVWPPHKVADGEGCRCIPRGRGSEVIDDMPAWSIRSVLISVTDIEVSAAFYRDLVSVHQILRYEQMVVLTNAAESLTLILRQTHRNPTRPGQQALGLRAITYDVGSVLELSRVEQRLRALDAFRDRREAENFEIVRGHDPDRLPLTFLAHRAGRTMSAADYQDASAIMYSADA
jgi:hypothetical protein